MPNTIYLGYIEQNSSALLVEGLAIDAFLPGTIVERKAGGLETTAKADTDFSTECLVALEYGDHVDQGVDDAYTIGDTAIAAKMRSGEVAYVRCAVANITTKGLALASNGDGTLKIAATDGSDKILFNSEQIINVTVAGTLVKVSKA